MTESDLLALVDAAFATTGRGLAPWPAPHPGESPLDEEYSRLTDPGRWRIVGARADAWLHALVEAGVADVDRGPIGWAVEPRETITSAARCKPHARDATTLVVARTEFGHVPGAGVVLAVGDPATPVARFPFCGCDACDDGSDYEVNSLDEHILGIVSGNWRELPGASWLSRPT